MAEFGPASRETWREVLIIAFVMNECPIYAYNVTVYRTSYLALMCNPKGFRGIPCYPKGFRGIPGHQKEARQAFY